METCSAYPIFEENQVLTAGQLNELTSYLETHQRLTRNKLLGVGVLCGLEVRTSREARQRIIISEGSGVTSEGFLITTEASMLTRYRPYVDPSRYSPFWPNGFESDQLEIVELLPAVVENEDATIQDLTTSFLNDKALVLFVECHEVDIDTCTGDNCNELGKHLEHCIRKLAIKKSDLRQIIKDGLGLGGSDDLASYLRDKYDLPSISLGRESDLRTLTGSLVYDDLRDYYNTLVAPVITPLENALIEAHGVYAPALNLGANPFRSGTLEALLADFLLTNRCDIQYYFDFVADLICAYEEFKTVAFDAVAQCCPSKQLFPKHLAIGEVYDRSGCEPSIYRQTYIPAPVYNNQAQLIAEAQMLLRRMALLIQNFKVPTARQSNVRITPSAGPTQVLSQRAIPYYYEVAQEKPINRFWNHDLARKCLSHTIPSYNASEYAGAAPANISAPLLYQADQSPFFRIEGHIGKQRTDVESRLEQLVQNRNLPIKTLPLSLGELLGVGSTILDCRSEDLETLYATCRDELVCLLQREIKFFSDIQYFEPEAIYEDGTTGVRVMVRDTNGDVLGNVRLKLTAINGDPEILPGVPNDDGSFQVVSSTMDPGEYKLSITRDAFNGKTIDVSIVKDKVQVLEVVLEEFSSIFDRLDIPWFEDPYFTEKLGPLGGDPLGPVDPRFGPIGGDPLGPVDPRFGPLGGDPPSPVDPRFGPLGGDPLGPVDPRFGPIGGDPLGPVDPRFGPIGGVRGLESRAEAFAFSGETVSESATLRLGVTDPRSDFQTGDFLKHSVGELGVRSSNTIGDLYLSYGASGTDKSLLDYSYAYLSDVLLIPTDSIGIIIVQLNRPLQIVAKIEATVVTLTGKLKDFHHDAFESAFTALLKEAESYKSEVLESLLGLSDEEGALGGEILDHLTAILVNCSFDKFRAILNSSDSRQREIQKILQFSHFVSKHPGLEHQAGVPRGGTFIFVYDETGKVVGDFALPYICCSDCPPINICYVTPIVFKLPKNIFCHDDDTDYHFILSPPGGQITSAPGVEIDSASGRHTFNPTRAGVVPGDHLLEYSVDGNSFFFNISVVQLVADFAFQIVSVDIPNDTAEVEFTASPQNGEFTWDFGDGSEPFETVTPVTHHVYSGLNNQPFNVNLRVDIAECNDTTTKSITIIEISAEFSLVTDLKPEAMVVDAKALQRDAISYRWKMKVDGKLNASGTDIDFLELVPRTNVDQTVVITLKVTKGATETSSQRFTVPATEVRIEIASSFCKSDPRQYEIVGFPAGGIMSGPGIFSGLVVPRIGTGNRIGTKYSFAPASPAVNTETIEISYKAPDGRTARKEITVSPIAAFSVASVTKTLLTAVRVRLLNEATEADKYIWDFGGAAPARVNLKPLTVVVTFPNVRPGQSIPVTLTAVKGDCQHSVTQIVTIPQTLGGLDFDFGGANIKLPDGTRIGLRPTVIEPSSPLGPDILVGRNISVLEEFKGLDLFNATLTIEDAVYKSARDYLAGLQTELAVPAIQEAYAAGERNADIAKAFDAMFGSAFRKIKKIRGADLPNKRQLLQSIVLVEINQLLTLVNNLAEDFNESSTLAKSFDTLQTNLESTRGLGVDIDPGEALTVMLKESATAALNKPNYTKALDSLQTLL